mmetsp:Transcript_22214/g.61881  ORF Transcript_22214/g.61881 Transcript_22214/m.61881 type:complete len:95 (+) Transcript_22214:931-1215(+)
MKCFSNNELCHASIILMHLRLLSSKIVRVLCKVPAAPLLLQSRIESFNHASIQSNGPRYHEGTSARRAHQSVPYDLLIVIDLSMNACSVFGFVP